MPLNLPPHMACYMDCVEHFSTYPACKKKYHIGIAPHILTEGGHIRTF